MSKALEHCGYEASNTPGGAFEISLTTLFAGATIHAALSPQDDSGRYWTFVCQVLNCKGTGWTVRGGFADCGRAVAKRLLTSMALQLRRAYCCRGQKIRKRAMARAKAKQLEEANE